MRGVPLAVTLAVVAVASPLLATAASGWPRAAAQQGAQPAGSSPSAAPAVRIVLVGDSTVTDDSGWGRGFKAQWTDAVTCVNAARNGRSSKSYRDEGHWTQALAEPGDFVLIQFGHNDQPGKGPERETDPATSFRANLGRYVDEARAAGMTPVLVTSLTRRTFDGAGHIASDLGPYADATAAVAADRGTPLIDLHRISIEWLNRTGPERSGAIGPLKPDNTYDTTHLSERGSEVMGSLVAAELVRVVPALAPYRRPPGITWRECLSQDAAWYAGPEATRIAGNVLLYQRATGGWPKDLDMARVLDTSQRAVLVAGKSGTDSTIDNGATTTQMRYLARMIAGADREPYRAAFLAGLGYLLAAQYPNGGWPQFFPLRTDYSRHVTFNDDATVSVVRLLGEIAAGGALYGFVDPALRSRASAAASRGVGAMLATQVRVNGRLTCWAAQYDAVTLKPAPARTYEMIALSSNESAGIVTYLMELPDPSPDVVAAVDACAAWMRDVQLAGLRIESRFDPASPRGWDRVVVPDPKAPPVWARFYEVGTNRPLFSDRDGVVKNRLDDIGYERRTGYAWYGTWPASVLSQAYPAWKARQTR